MTRPIFSISFGDDYGVRNSIILHDVIMGAIASRITIVRLFRRKSKKTSKFCVTGLCAGNSPGPVNSPHKCPVTRKMFPFDDAIKITYLLLFMQHDILRYLYIIFTLSISMEALMGQSYMFPNISELLSSCIVCGNKVIVTFNCV